MMKVGIGATALAALLLSGTAHAQDKLKVGVTATLEGTYTILGVDGIAGFNAAVKKYGSKAGGKELEFVIASTDATPDSAVRAVRKLIDQDHVQILISPPSGDEGTWPFWSSSRISASRPRCPTAWRSWSRRFAGDRELQQRLLGVGRHSEAPPEAEPRPADARPEAPPGPRPRRAGAPAKVYVSNPVLPTRWSQPVPNARIEASARTSSVGAARTEESPERRTPTLVTHSGPPSVIVVGTLDTKGPELRFIRDLIAASGLRTRLVDVSNSGKLAICDKLRRGE